MTLFVATFTTLLAIINPLEALPVYLGLAGAMDDRRRLRLALRSCLYALGLMFFFLLFGTLLLKVFGVSLPMIRIAGGIILAQIGFKLFSSPSSMERTSGGSGGEVHVSDVAFVPMAMPIMFGPGAMATLISMASEVEGVKQGELAGFAEISAALVATMAATFVILAFAKRLQKRLGPRGIDAATRIVGFFVAAMGIGMAFDGTMEALKSSGFGTWH
jgi:multiple antibiotic resistance protein